MTAPVETKQDIKVDHAWSRLMHTMARTMPRHLVQVANARRGLNSLFKGGR